MGGTILVVDDDVTLRRTVCEALEDAGYSTLGAANGADALALLNSAGVRPCLILLDVSMPRMDGLTFLKVMESDARLRGVPVALVSGMQVDHAMTSAVVATLRKPASLDRLLEVVKQNC